MRRTVLVWTPAAALVAGAWLRLEQPSTGTVRVVALLVLALVPLVSRRAAVRAVLAAGALLAAAAVAAGTTAPREIWDRADNGLRAFYSLTVPFDPKLHPEMHALVLFAIFVFALGLGLAVAARRPVAACLLLAAGSAWPSTLLGGSGALTRGALLLATCLYILALLGPQRALRPALAAGALLVLASLAASSAVARAGIVDWQQWNPYTAGREVSVAYIWRSQYRGIRFPSRPTTVFEVQAPDTARYWRATTLDRFEAGVWDESLTVNIAHPVDGRDLLTNDPTLPRRAGDQATWLRQRFFIRALADDHLPAAATPVAYDSGDVSSLYSSGGVALRPGGLHREDTYTVWSYAPRPKPRALAGLGADYPSTDDFGRYLTVWGGEAVPAFGSPGREAAIAHLFATDASARRYEPLYRVARRVVGHSATPYGAAVALETWFRTSGGFIYDEQPPQPQGATPALVDFVTRTKAGYCQHFAGAMALMLRYLGVPARVAAGFTSGRWDAATKRWVVSDRDAHAWVEVWFPGYGWLPFDPTPSRGTLDAPYSDASASFDPGGAATAFAAGGAGLGLEAILKLARLHGRGAVLPPPASPAAVASGGGSGFPFLAVGGGVLVAAGLLAGVVLAKGLRRRLRYATSDPRRLAAACRRELEELAADQGVVVPRGASGGEAAALVEEQLGVDARPVARAVAEARFGPPARAGEAAASARRELAAFRRNLRSRLTLGRRVRGAFSLRSL